MEQQWDELSRRLASLLDGWAVINLDHAQALHLMTSAADIHRLVICRGQEQLVGSSLQASLPR